GYNRPGLAAIRPAEPLDSTLLGEINMANPIPSRPQPNEYAAAFEAYIKLVPECDILERLEQQIEGTLTLLRDVSESEAETRHAPYPGSFKEAIGPFIDSEGFSGVRAPPFPRQDPTELPGFDENHYVRHAGFDLRPLGSLAQEFEFVRRSHILFFRGLDDEA